ncbi:DUF2752 domain-containing protein [Planosporangium flavigriseum]|uniref:DUF2752 domain-containing protein n=1 Tax=Planosporangium flavigriseum TaxID=373681 RepID=A0A8J3LLL5_9ACTN|nr:DUF2752 domain-containing protein [Planosporangium flavigriseum]NJC64054.1 DUF2752 domain-containing protein [Planosporangium flavigriseum]GIG72935.1 hypothetical protein Pfl04_13390 [Planosporangium flavigriseum]
MSQTSEQAAVAQPVPPYPLPRPSRFSRFVLKTAERTPGWAAPAAIATCFAGAVGYVLVADPTTSDPYSPPTCLLKLTTGFDCPGCGGTRAFWYLLHGNLPQAARNHALFVFAVPFLLYMYVAWAARLVLKRDVLPAFRLSPMTLSMFLAVWFVFSVLRNLPWAPFTWLYV